MRLGLGAGWYEDEYNAHGFQFPAFKVRQKQLEEGCRIIRGMTLGRRVDFDGAYFSAHVDCYPTPAKNKVHLIGGGKNPRILRALADYVDEWNVYSSPLELFQKIRAILGEARASESPPLEFSEMGTFLIAESEGKLNERMENLAKIEGLDMSSLGQLLSSRMVPAGMVDQFVEKLNTKIDGGVERYYFQVLNPKDKDMVDSLTDTLKSRF